MISCSDLTVKKGTSILLDNITANINCGEISVVIGPNGAGKSTLLKAFSGFEKTQSGNVFFNNYGIEEYSLHELAKKRSVLSQQSVMNFPFKVAEIVMMGRHPFIEGSESCEDIEIVKAAMQKADISHLHNRIFSTLSGGEQQRVQLARVLAQIWNGGEGNYLFLDEPVSNLDLKHQYMILRIARDLANKGVGVFCILHDLNLAAKFGDKIIMMKAGKIFDAGKKDKVFTEKNLIELFEIEDEVARSFLRKCCLE